MWVAGKILTRAIPEQIRGGLRQCATQIDVYFTLLYFGVKMGATDLEGEVGQIGDGGRKSACRHATDRFID